MAEDSERLESLERETENRIAVLQKQHEQVRGTLELMAGAPDEVRAQLEAKQTELEAKLAEIQTVGSRTGGQAEVSADRHGLAARDLIGSTVITGDVTIHQAAREAARKHEAERKSSSVRSRKATEGYLQYLADRYRYLELKGMGVSDRVALQLPLLELYVPLEARMELPKGETWDRGTLIAGRGAQGMDDEDLQARPGKPTPVLELVRDNDGLVVLGDPGSGKTTLLKHLAVALALGQEDALGLGPRLPVLVPLSAYADALAEERSRRLDDFVAAYVRSLGGDEAIAGVLADDLTQGRALVLLDGLDEVRDVGLRGTVSERVSAFFAFHRRAGNKFVITSRIVGYPEVRPVADGLIECTLVDFGDEEIAAFAERWTSALERQASGATEVAASDAESEREGLLTAIRSNPGVRRLAANPLLLTILALMKRQGKSLPERRVELYDQYVTTLLSSWNRTRGLDRKGVPDLDVHETLQVLAPLARWMHEEDPGRGLVHRAALTRRLEAIYRERGAAEPEAAARAFLADLRDHAGLLLERGSDLYGFIHLTFEEYLVAVAIALDAQGDAEEMSGALEAKIGEPEWREPTLLLVGYVGLIQHLFRVAGKLLESLVRERPGPPGEAVVLAGEALADVGDAGVGKLSRRAVVEALVETMQDGGVSMGRRRRAGLLLGRLGWVPEDLDVFVEVPAGPLLFGEEKKTRQIERRYWIARYPVTNLQYECFVEVGGYDREEFWSEMGWRWRTEERRASPLWFSTDFENPIAPRVGVTWYEADAYARWLTESTREILVADRGTLAVPEGYSFRLPTEEEWERAARGTDGREHPWGETFDPSHANTEEGFEGDLESRGTSAICTYPRGAGPSGAWDMAGNVFEWTATQVKEESRKCFYLRGGSFYFDRRDARCAARGGYGPDCFSNGIGFRLVLSLAISEP